jgi:hypothetical protein
MSRIFHAMRSVRWASLGAALVVLLVPTTASSAEGGSEIEGVWSFNGGAVDIIAVPGGKYEGIVTVQTQFASCAHKVEERMWTDITPQPDGSYWGLHQWFHGAPECAKNTQLGATAWRIMHEPNGSRFLRVCFSNPGSPQPTIASDGAPKEASENAAHHVTYGCVSSELIAPLPVAQGSDNNARGGVESLTLRKAGQCLRPGVFKIRLRDPKYDPLKKVTVIFKGHKVSTSRRGSYVVAAINLAHFKKSRFTVKIHATTLLGHKLNATRTYRICKKAKHHGKPHKQKTKKG